MQTAVEIDAEPAGCRCEARAIDIRPSTLEGMAGL